MYTTLSSKFSTFYILNTLLKVLSVFNIILLLDVVCFMMGISKFWGLREGVDNIQLTSWIRPMVMCGFGSGL